MTDVVCRWLRVPFQEFLGHQNKSRRAKAALKGAILDERLLDRMKLVAAGESFDRHHFTSVDKGREIQASAHGQAIYERRAAATQSLPAAFSTSEQTEITT